MGFGAMSREQTAGQVARLVRHWEERGYSHWVVEEKATGAFVGRIGLQYQDDWSEGEHKTEVGWLLGRSFWGRGFATEGALASLRYGLERIISITLPQNLASRRVMEKAGLTPRGETRWRGFDVVWYDIGRREWEIRQQKPTS